MDRWQKVKRSGEAFRRKTACGKMLHRGGLTWRDLGYETAIQCVHVHTPLCMFMCLYLMRECVSDLKTAWNKVMIPFFLPFVEEINEASLTRTDSGSD